MFFLVTPLASSLPSSGVTLDYERSGGEAEARSGEGNKWWRGSLSSWPPPVNVSPSMPGSVVTVRRFTNGLLEGREPP